jgi:hypothetical protein
MVSRGVESAQAAVDVRFADEPLDGRGSQNAEDDPNGGQQRQ